MNFTTLTPESLQAAVSLTRKRPPRGVKRPRANEMACYTPPGDAQASRRVTGSHLDPDSKDMEVAAMYFAEGLVDAMGEGRSMVRSLIGPARYSDRILEKYCQRLFKGAMGKPSPTIEAPISPLLVQYLLGGMTWASVEECCHRALRLLDFDAEPAGAPTLGASLSLVGFGRHIRHDHTDFQIKFDVDNTPYEVEYTKQHAHLSFRQDYLLALPRTGSYATLLIRDGGYGEGLRRQIASWKHDIMLTAERLLDPKGGEMATWMLENVEPVRQPVKPTDFTFKRAVKRVFEQDWDQLDLLCGPPGTELHDAEVLMARLIIQRLGYAPPMTAECLVGMSLLTGISVANWVQFAVLDKQRRGETFITTATVERVIELCEYQAGFHCEEELRDGMYSLADTERNAAKKRWARRLQSKTNPLWSTNGLYYQVSRDQHKVPICKPRAFNPNHNQRSVD